MKSSLIYCGFSGYGHYKLKIEYSNGKIYQAITNNMRLIDSYQRDVITRKDEQIKAASLRALIRFVKDQNNLK